MVKSILLVVAVWLTGCALTPISEIPEHHPAHPSAPQASWGERVTTLAPDLEREGTADKKPVEKEHGGHHRHGH